MSSETAFVWRDRLVKLDEDGTWMLSARGNHEDFDYGATSPSTRPFGAVAGKLDTRVYNIERIDENNLRLYSDAGPFILNGDDFFGKEGQPCNISKEPQTTK